MNYFFFIYHGYGWAVLLILGASFAVLEALLKALNVASRTATDLSGGLAYICAAVPCWFLGRYLLSYQATVKDKETGQKTKVPQPYHALFWIPMHWWAPIFMVIGVCILISDAQKPAAASPPQDSPAIVSAPPPQRPQTIQGGALHYSITLPSGWDFARDQEHFDIFTTTNSSNGDFWLGVYALPGSQADTERWVEIFQRDSVSKFGGVLTRAHDATIDSHPWAVLNGTIQADGTTLTCRIYAYSEQGSAYAIMLVAIPTAWKSRATDLMSIARSFTFPTLSYQQPPPATVASAPPPTSKPTYQGTPTSFASSDKDFFASFPAQPTETRKTGEIRGITIPRYRAQLRDGNWVYAVERCDYPASFADSASPTQMLDDARDAAVFIPSATLLSESSLTLQGYPGRQIQVRSEDGKWVASTRMFVVKHHLYQVMTVTPPTQMNDQKVKDFLNSFKLSK